MNFHYLDINVIKKYIDLDLYRWLVDIHKYVAGHGSL